MLIQRTAVAGSPGPRRSRGCGRPACAGPRPVIRAAADRTCYVAALRRAEHLDGGPRPSEVVLVRAGSWVVPTALVALVVGLALVAMPVGGQPRTVVTRLSAATPVEAGLVVSRHLYADGEVDHVVLVRDDRFPDALVAGPLSGELPGTAPILFTRGEVLDPAVREEAGRVTGGGGTVHILGGEAAVGAGVAQELEADGFVVQRVSGATRVETALQVFATYFAADLLGRDVLVARGFGTPPAEADGWADAVGGGAFGAARGVPILLSPTDGLPQEVADAIRGSGASAAIVLGGTRALSAGVEEGLRAVVPEVVRVAGASREDTARQIAAQLFGIPSLTADDTAVVVNGRDSFAFGLAAAPLAARGGGPSDEGARGDAPLLLATVDSPTASGDCTSGTAVAGPTACALFAPEVAPGPVILLGDEAQLGPAVEQAVAARGSAG